MRKLARVLLATAAASLVAAVPGPAWSQQKIVLKGQSSHPASSN
jgi:hypothetical protein